MDKLKVSGDIELIGGRLINRGETELNKMLAANKADIEKFHNTIKNTENLTQVRIKSPEIREPRKKLFGIF
jgi:hypothetical protein